MRGAVGAEISAGGSSSSVLILAPRAGGFTPSARSSPAMPNGKGRCTCSTISPRHRDRQGALVTNGKYPGLWVQIVEFAVLHPGHERRDLGPRIYQRRSRRVPGIADGDRAIGKLGDLDTAPAGVADLALAPGRGDQLIGRDAVVELHRSPYFSLSGNVEASAYRSPASCTVQPNRANANASEHAESHASSMCKPSR